jgi:hypothetical protein
MSALTAYYKKYPQEKIYVQTDKTVYTIGQTIWYKIYATVYGGSETLSKIVYIQLVDSKGKIISQNKLPLIKGKAYGDIQLPDSLRSDSYQLRSFTAWMLNFDDSAVFRKDLYIKNIPDTINNQSNNKLPIREYHVQFFPEGGDLIDGITGNVAFKATDQTGLPFEIQGEIKDENQSLINSFSTLHDGMGKFSIRTFIKHHYYVLVHLPDHSTQNIPLPPAKKFGISMKMIEQTKNGVTIQVVYREAEVDQYHDIVLAVYQNTGKVATYPLQLEPGINDFNITNKEFKTGILRLTIFDKNGLPQAERILFLDKKDQVQLQLQKDTLSCNSKAKSAFTLQIKDVDWKIDKANISVSVTDADRVMGDSMSDNIYSSLLLNSELKGYVYNPGYYFDNNVDSVKNALDLVMMTNGWRHFEWKQILNYEPVKLNYPVEESLYIAGKLIGYKPGKQNDNFLKMIIEQGGSTRFIGYVSPDSNGSFILKDYSVPGLSTVYFQEEKGKRGNKNYKVEYFADSLDTIHTAVYIPMSAKLGISMKNEFIAGTWNNEEEQLFLIDKKSLLKPVIVKGYIPTKTEMLVKKYVSPYFESGNAHNIDLINNFYPNSLRLFDFLHGRFPGLIVAGTEEDPEFYFRGTTPQEFVPIKQTVNDDFHDPNRSIATSYPYIYINETHSTYQDIKDIPLSEIAIISYIPPPASMAPLNGGAIGVLAIYLKKWTEDIKSANITQEYNYYIFHGYSIARQFYSPDYSAKDSAFSKTDNRTTLYWNPDMTADSNNNVHFYFYNSDHAKKFRIVAEGMDQQGRIAYFNQIVKED